MKIPYTFDEFKQSIIIKNAKFDSHNGLHGKTREIWIDDVYSFSLSSRSASNDKLVSESYYLYQDMVYHEWFDDKNYVLPESFLKEYGCNGPRKFLLKLYYDSIS